MAGGPKVYFEVSVNGIPTSGRIVIELFYDIVPKTARNFRVLCSGESGLGYKGSIIYRIVPNFQVEGGDITNNNGTGGKSIYGAKFDDENFTVKHTEPGILSMVSIGPNTNNSKFIITTVKAPWLDGKQVAFGKVIEGLDIVKKMEAYGSQNGKPHAEIRIINSGVFKQ